MPPHQLDSTINHGDPDLDIFETFISIISLVLSYAWVIWIIIIVYFLFLKCCLRNPSHQYQSPPPTRELPARQHHHFIIDHAGETIPPLPYLHVVLSAGDEQPPTYELLVGVEQQQQHQVDVFGSLSKAECQRVPLSSGETPPAKE